MSYPIVVQFGSYRLDPARRLLLRDGEPVALTPKAFDALLLLVERRDHVVSKQELLKELWPSTAVEDATLSQHIFMVRRALNDTGNPNDLEYIATIPRRGYRFVAPVQAIESVIDDRFYTAVGTSAGVAHAHIQWVSAMKRAGGWKVAALLVAGVMTSIVWTLPPRVTAQKVVRLTFLLPEDQRLWRLARGAVALSPEGGSVVYATNRQLYLRRLNESEARPIHGTNLDVSTPFFSPDGQWIGFWSSQDSMLMKIPISGGTAVAIGPASNPRGASWFGDIVVFAEGGKGVMAVPTRGGSPELWTKADEDEVLQSPQVLPGGESVMFTAAKVVGNRTTRSDVVVYSRKTGVRTLLVTDGSTARYLGTGHIIYAVGTSLFAASFDSQRLKVAGRPSLMVEQVGRNFGGVVNFDASADGTLVYALNDVSTGLVDRKLALTDRAGRIEVLTVAPATYQDPRISPDGTRIAVTTADNGGTIWIYHMSRTNSLRRLTFQGRSQSPVWSPDGKRVAFGSTRDGDAGIFAQAVDGTGVTERLTTSRPGFVHVPGSWSRDGKTVLFANVKAGIKDTILDPCARGSSGQPDSGGAGFQPDGSKFFP